MARRASGPPVQFRAVLIHQNNPAMRLAGEEAHGSSRAGPAEKSILEGEMETIPSDETARDLKRRKRAHALKFGIEALDRIPEFQFGLCYPQVCDIHGPSGSGKTEILLHLCLNTCPRYFDEVYIGGNGSSILFICMGQSPGECLPRLMTLYDLHARKAWDLARRQQNPASAPDSPTEQWIESLVLDSMSRVHFVHCSNSLQVLASEHCAETLIKTESALSAIVVDCLSAFQVWCNRAFTRVVLSSS